MKTNIAIYRTVEEMNAEPCVLDKYRENGILNLDESKIESITGGVWCERQPTLEGKLQVWAFHFNDFTPKLVLDTGMALLKFSHSVVDYFVYANVLLHWEKYRK